MADKPAEWPKLEAANQSTTVVRRGVDGDILPASSGLGERVLLRMEMLRREEQEASDAVGDSIECADEAQSKCDAAETTEESQAATKVLLEASAHVVECIERSQAAEERMMRWERQIVQWNRAARVLQASLSGLRVRRGVQTTLAWEKRAWHMYQKASLLGALADHLAAVAECE